MFIISRNGVLINQVAGWFTTQQDHLRPKS